jgi:phosphoglycolate phosphatase
MNCPTLSGIDQLRLVAFDLDGTLVDSFEDIAQAANHALASLGFPTHPTAFVKQHVGRGLQNLLGNLVPSGEIGSVPTLLKTMRAYYSEHPTDYSTLYPGALSLLDHLGVQGIIRVILSNKADPLVQQIAVNLELATRVEVILGHREEFPLKPDPTSLRWILDKDELQPSDCLLVGDGYPDWELSQNAGILFCAVTYGLVARHDWELAGVNWIVDSLEELFP